MTEKEFMLFFEQHFGLFDDEEILNLIVKELSVARNWTEQKVEKELEKAFAA